MKAVILAGGLGTRISEESSLRPKPMVEIGGKPILWHIMKHLEFYGIHDFVICAGYKSHMIKDFFINYRNYHSDITISLNSGEVKRHTQKIEAWNVTIVDSGIQTGTGGRLLSAKEHLGSGNFLMTYGDGLSDVDISMLIDFHDKNRSLVSVTAVQTKSRYGHLRLEMNQVTAFKEKQLHEDIWVNGGFFVINSSALDYISGYDESWENLPLERITADQQLTAYKHYGFWQSMDTIREKNYLENLWETGKAPWKIW